MAIEPILFDTKMVQAILEGRKTQTRRIADDWQPPCEPGDILWVQETWRPVEARSSGWCRIEYKAGGIKVFKKIISVPKYQEPWHPAILMPKEAARIFLRVKDVQIERLNDMSEDDAIAEGFADSPAGTDSPLERYSVYWDKHIKRADLREYGWDDNPWVWAIEFEMWEIPEGWCE